MSLPDKCPFCGAEPYTTVSGEQCRVVDRWVMFSCDTSIYAWQDLRKTQSRKCEVSERNRMLARVTELEARCKRLEEAGDNLDSSIACGCGVDGPCQMCRRASDSWQQSKEAKP